MTVGAANPTLAASIAYAGRGDIVSSAHQIPIAVSFRKFSIFGRAGLRRRVPCGDAMRRAYVPRSACELEALRVSGRT
jgi:hypothetical protein